MIQRLGQCHTIAQFEGCLVSHDLHEVHSRTEKSVSWVYVTQIEGRFIRNTIFIDSRTRKLRLQHFDAPATTHFLTRDT